MKTNYNRDFFIPEETNYQIFFFFCIFFIKLSNIDIRWVNVLRLNQLLMVVRIAGKMDLGSTEWNLKYKRIDFRSF